MEERYIVAFEIGSSKVKGAVAVVDPMGMLNVVAVEQEKMVDKVRYGCVKNVGDVVNAVNLIRHKLENYSRVSPNKIKAVYVAVGGRSLMSVPREVEETFPHEIDITERVINDLKKQAGASVFSDRDVLDVVARSFRVDNMSQLKPVGTYGRSIVADFNIITCRSELKNNLHRVFSERLDLKIGQFIVRPLAVADLVLTDDEKRLGVMLVDCGAETTTVSIYKDGCLQYVATLPIGSRNITRDLTVLNCLEERAEEIKKAVGNAMPQNGTPHTISADGLDYTEINNYVQARADEIVSNILEQVNYTKMKLSDIPAGIVLVGGGAKLRGFSELVAQQSRLKVRNGVIGGGIVITPPDLNTTDILDIVAVLAEAAKQSGVDCMERLKPVTETESHDDEISRIGIHDEDSDDVLRDEDDNCKDRDKSKNSDKKSKSEQKKQTKTKDNEPERTQIKSRGLLNKLREKVLGLVDDTSENFDDNDE